MKLIYFCSEFWDLTPFHLQVKKGINHHSELAARFDLGYLGDNHGKHHATSALSSCCPHAFR